MYRVQQITGTNLCQQVKRENEKKEFSNNLAEYLDSSSASFMAAKKSNRKEELKIVNNTYKSKSVNKDYTSITEENNKSCLSSQRSKS